jgi:hypothetical protein
LVKTITGLAVIGPLTFERSTLYRLFALLHPCVEAVRGIPSSRLPGSTRRAFHNAASDAGGRPFPRMQG